MSVQKYYSSELQARFTNARIAFFGLKDKGAEISIVKMDLNTLERLNRTSDEKSVLKSIVDSMKDTHNAWEVTRVNAVANYSGGKSEGVNAVKQLENIFDVLYNMANSILEPLLAAQKEK